ncbi:alpha-L-fucosidase [Dyadobacter sp. CY312]|uniref:alpha-L-fucosidase n=1 Tax=Dyadobacter sp. CY312 TaxID=2907303 RepID=UPI001F1BE21C|nr:alpha-L-fucosidase [Dyadobacter sp. CY312]MCE7040778.1 alpha-L-fucosidase [Dyadobacter sp. CY312]
MIKPIATLLLLTGLNAFAQQPPKPYGALPAPRQIEWHKTEVYGLIHFTPTTFENKEWGFGDADPQTFNPTDFNAEQIILAAKAGGLRGIVFVAKHHDGFALWPTKTTDYNISKSPFRGGKGDMVKEVADAARKHGLKFGVYCSPWDRNNAKYGSPEYLEIYRQQLKELYTNYGELFMSWHDGANGGDGFYGGAKEKRSIDNTTYYQWDGTWSNLTRKLQPSANIFSDIGWDVRWAGNEDGSVNETSWATLTPVPSKGQNVAVPGQANADENPGGTRNGKSWIPAECDVPLRKGWFYHANEKPKTPEKLFDLYMKSVGRGAALDLGLAPDTRGQLHDDDVAALKSFGDHINATFATNLIAKANSKAVNVRGYNSIYSAKNILDGKTDSYWATDDDFTTPEVVVDLSQPITFDIISLQEYIKLGQRIEEFAVDVWEGTDWKQVHKGTSVGAKRLVKLAVPVTGKRFRLRITKSPVCVAISEFGLYKDSE